MRPTRASTQARPSTSPSPRPSSSRSTPSPDDSGELQAFVLELGRALSLAGTAVSETQERLSAVANASGVADARVIVLPTALMISFGRTGSATIESIPQLAGALRLDQISSLYELVDEAERGEVDPEEGLRRMERIRAMRPRYGPLVTVLAYAFMTLGLCLVLRPTPSDLPVSAGLGALVGVLALLARDRPTLRVLVPVLSATVVAAVTFELVKHGAVDPGMSSLIAPLVTFLPGSALTTATVELASGEMVAGSSRLVFGSLRLLLLAFGIIAGTQLVSLPHPQALLGQHTDALGPWAPWLGVFIFGVAVTIYFSAPRGALPWIVLVVFVAWLGQLVGESIVSADVSGFFGALAM